MKKQLLFIALIASMSAMAQIPTNGLVAHYPFNGNANDASGKGNNGTVNGATLTDDRFGNPNSAYSFDGIGNYISVPSSSTLNLGATDFTINCWIKEVNNSDVTPHGIITKSTPTNASGNGWQLMTKFNKFCSEFKIGTTYTIFQGDTVVSDDTWHMITWQSDKTNKKIFYYVDGVLIKSDSSNEYTQDISNTFQMNIGTDRGLNPGTFFNGKIDNIAIYNRALSASEIQQLYNENVCFQTVYDTVQVIDTVYVTINDTNHVTVTDTSYVTITDTNYISVTDTLVINTVLSGIAPPNNVNAIKVFPNPAKDHVYINTGNYSLMNGYSIKVTNTTGQTVFQSLINQQEFSIDLSTWSGTGTYIISIIDNQANVIEARKIILE